jgi:putative ABC transport system permease protein
MHGNAACESCTVWRLTRRGLISHFPRLVLTIVGIATAVAFISGIQVVTATLDRSVASVFSDIYGHTDVFVKGKAGETGTFASAFGGQRSSVAEEVVASLREQPGIVAAEGQVQEPASIFGPDGRPVSDRTVPPTFGMNWLGDSPLNGWRIAEGEAPRSSDDAVLDLRTASAESMHVGDEVGVLGVDGAVHHLRLVGLARFGTTDSFAGSTVLLTTTPTAQRLFLAPSTFSWISVVGQPGMSQEEVRVAAYPAVPAQDRAVTRDEFTTEAQGTFLRFVAFLKRFLLAFAYVALLVGAYSIFNTFSIVVTQRHRELALLRALGATRRQVVVMVVLEAIAVGLLASLAGVAVGIGLASLAARSLTGSGIVSSSVGTVVPLASVGAAVGFGWGVTIVAAVLPALRASRVRPVAALRGEMTAVVRTDWLRLVMGGLSLVLGLVTVAAGLSGSRAGTVGLERVSSGLAMSFVGLAFVAPLFWAPATRVLSAPVVRVVGTVGRLARDNAVRNPLRTSRVATALIVGVGVLTMFSVMASSLASSSASAAQRSIKADLVVHPDVARGGVVADDVAASLSRVPGVAVTSGFRFGGAEVDNLGAVAVGIDPATVLSVLDIKVVRGSLDAMGETGVALPRAVVDAQGWDVGRELQGEFVQTGYEKVHLTAVFDGEVPFASSTPMLMPKAALDRRVPAAQRGDAALLVVFDASARTSAPERTRQAVVAAVADHPVLRVDTIADFTEAQVAPADTFLNVVSALLLVAMLIAFVGIANTLLLSVYERVPEIGVLRAIGMQRREVRAMFRWEAVLIATLGSSVGLVAGLGAGWALARAADGSPDLAIAIPWARLLASAIVAVLLAMVAAVLPARRAARLDVLEAIAIR